MIIEALEKDNRVLKKTILEQQKFIEGMRRDKVKNNIFITGIPSSHTIKENNVTDKEIIIQHIIKYIKNEVNNGHYKIVKFLILLRVEIISLPKLHLMTIQQKWRYLKIVKSLVH